MGRHPALEPKSGFSVAPGQAVGPGRDAPSTQEKVGEQAVFLQRFSTEGDKRGDERSVAGPLPASSLSRAASLQRGDSALQRTTPLGFWDLGILVSPTPLSPPVQDTDQASLFRLAPTLVPSAADMLAEALQSPGPPRIEGGSSVLHEPAR